jgi:hypothetical protein
MKRLSKYNKGIYLKDIRDDTDLTTSYIIFIDKKDDYTLLSRLTILEKNKKVLLLKEGDIRYLFIIDFGPDYGFHTNIIIINDVTIYIKNKIERWNKDVF